MTTEQQLLQLISLEKELISQLQELQDIRQVLLESIRNEELSPINIGSCINADTNTSTKH